MSEHGRLWHVTVTVAGAEVEPLMVRNGLRRLSDERPFLHSMRYCGHSAEIQYWEEAHSLVDASSLALRVWNEHRQSAGLPSWEVVGLEVLERHVFLSRAREHAVEHATLSELQDVVPVPF